MRELGRKPQAGDTEKMWELRMKFLEQTKKYFGVHYHRKYWGVDTPEYNEPFFLDCCGLVRRVMRDLQDDFGFRMGPWNQAYQFDTLPIVLEEKDMKPGDLVFISAIYNNKKSKKQPHNMVHVEVWLGDGPKTIGARWQKGVVQVFDSYAFEAKSYHSPTYLFRSIDTWLMGVCQSYCPEHPWTKTKLKPKQISKHSIFAVSDDEEDAGDTDDELIESWDEEAFKKHLDPIENIDTECSEKLDSLSIQDQSLDKENIGGASKGDSAPKGDDAPNDAGDDNKGGTSEPAGSGHNSGGNSGATKGNVSPSRGMRRDGKNGKKSPGDGSPRGSPTRAPARTSVASSKEPTFYIGGGNGNPLIEGPLVEMGWKRITDKYSETFKLKWVECKSTINYSAFREGDQLVNHIPNCNLLTNKMGLLNSLQEYERTKVGRGPKLKMNSFVPETYKLDRKADVEAFIETYKEGEIWICKPTGANQGKGIYLIRSMEEFEKTMQERQEKQQNTRPGRSIGNRIIQRYIHNPLLLEGKKFDIRAYMLIASTVPYLVVFHQGYVRLSMMDYDNDSTNLIAHLTNQYIQKKDPNYKASKEETAWSMDKFNDYINTKVAPGKCIEVDWVFKTFTETMKKIMVHLFKAVQGRLEKKIGFFDLYGLDFMIDDNMNIYLIEVNVNPSLATNCSALKDVIPGVVEESLHLAIECFEKSRKNQPIMPLKSLKKMTILHNGEGGQGSPVRGIRTQSERRARSPLKEATPVTRVPSDKPSGGSRSGAKSAPFGLTQSKVRPRATTETKSETLPVSTVSIDPIKLKMTHAITCYSGKDTVKDKNEPRSKTSVNLKGTTKPRGIKAEPMTQTKPQGSTSAAAGQIKDKPARTVTITVEEPTKSDGTANTIKDNSVKVENVKDNRGN
ncbi:unnamed protein product [Owenia fusiformis]|nr:unnamed protein product [Owenia fusiformis]